MTPTPEQTSHIIEDIKDIRDLINRKTSLYRQLYSVKNYRAGALMLGIWMIGMAALAQMLLMKYGGWSMIPLPVLATGIVIAALSAFGVKWVQIRGSIMAGNDVRKGMPFLQMMKEAVFSRVYVTIFSVMFVIIAASVHLRDAIDATCWMPLAGITTGIIYNIIALATRLTEHHVIGYWLIVTGLITLIIGNIQPHIVMAITFGLGFVGYAAFAYITGGKR